MDNKTQNDLKNNEDGELQKPRLKNIVVSTNPLAQFGRDFSDVAEHQYMNSDLSFVNFRQKVYDVEQSRNRSKRFFGRIYNVLTGSETETVQLSGAVLKRAYEAIEKPLPKEIVATGIYGIEFEKAKRLLEDFYSSLASKEDKVEGVVKR